jgi:sulfite exporter TauE/SafE
MNLLTVFGAGLLAGATTCAVAQGGLLVGLINRQKKAAVAAGRLPATGGRSAADDIVPVSGFLLGKLLVLTVVGVALGSVGAFVALDVRVGAAAQLAAAGYMICFGLGAAGVAGFRDVSFVPTFQVGGIVRKSTRSQAAAAPFLLGLATVVIPCGVTISMMLVAATSGSPLTGGIVMAVFVLGTAPMFALYGFLTQRYVSVDKRGASIALGSLVVVMGMFTLNGGLVALGSPVTAQAMAAQVLGRSDSAPAAPAPGVYGPQVPGATSQVLRVEATSGGYQPQFLAARAGVPTTLVIHTDQTRSCILFTVLPSLGKQVVLPLSGDTTLDLGTLEAGQVPIACSMGMYTGTIVVT